MPIYEYQCDKCNDHFELIQKFSDAPLTTHEKCGGAVHRLVSAPAFHFKGSGWYVTDYAKGGNSAPNGGTKKNEGSESKSSDSDNNKSGSSASAGSDNKTAPAETKTKSTSDSK